MVAAAIGTDKDFKRAEHLIKSGVDALVVDTYMPILVRWEMFSKS